MVRLGARYWALLAVAVAAIIGVRSQSNCPLSAPGRS